ncbi:MAG: monofunctional biosynthetic peptidoglycan transglycosylase [Nitrospiraceae bacterium]|jgi:monofunctional glycosyltransferase|nr:MAG: monofunctional biosynthetic peptidoglycan transglycosylase [Nitrospiraceae bacterium]
MKKIRSLFKRLFVLATLLLSIFIVFQFVYPDVSHLKKKNPGKTSFMTYRETEWKREGKKYRINQKWVPLRAISPYLVKAVLIGEDDKFWSHEGFDYEAMQKALEKDIKAKKFKLGGSTISQQLSKNLYLSPSKNPLRKIREAIITWRIEKGLSKKRILELYLNVAEWGDRGIFGIEAASRAYYGKSASALGPEEASRLAAVLPNPRRFNPLGNSRYVVHRSNLIYNIMVRRGIVVPEYEEISQENDAADNSASDSVVIPPESPPVEGLKPSE